MSNSFQFPMPRFSPSPRGERDGFPGFNPLSKDEILKKNRAWRLSLERAAGKTFEGCAANLFKSRGFGNLDESVFEKVLYQHILDLRQSAWMEGKGHADKTQAEKKALFDEVFTKTCTEIALERNREDLMAWVNRMRKGKALFVDCPMGVGKTYSIVQVLAQNRNLSAIIFMPTNRLCEQMVQDLKSQIIRNHPNLNLDYMDICHDEEVVDKDGNVLTDDIAGAPIFRWTRSFLEKEVYFADGINKAECPHFDAIVERYRENWIKKADLCKGCENKLDCRFISHWKKAPLSRIVVTTHHQYDRFYQQSGMRKWFKHGYERKEEAVPRDVFIVDEDLVLSRCYEPVWLDREEIRPFVAILTEFLWSLHETQVRKALRAIQAVLTLRKDKIPREIQILEAVQALREIEDLQKLRVLEMENNIHKLFSQSSLPDDTSVIPPVDPDFEFPKKVIAKWTETFPETNMLLPEYVAKSQSVGNHLELIESGLKLGVVVQRFRGRDRIYFANRTTYDLSKLPPHVFFDGTTLEHKFLEHKLQNVRFDRMSIQVEPLWRCKVYQNDTTDLPKNSLHVHRRQVQEFIQKVINEKGTKHRYFFLTKKAIREMYLKDFLKELESMYPQFRYVLEHFGNLRGINDANDCDVGVMLGSHNPSDAVEIAMGLEFIQDVLPKRIVVTRNRLWKQVDSNSRRSYESEYSHIQALADAVRLSEHRQGMARTRYLFHDVDFYVISKDPVSEYEPYAEVVPFQYSSDLFPGRSERSDNKYEEVKRAVFQLAGRSGTVTEMEIHRQTGISRTTIRKHLRRLLDAGGLVRRKTKYLLPMVDGLDSSEWTGYANVCS